MKQLFLLIFTGIIFQFAQAQTSEKLDQEKLLQYYEAQQYHEAVQYLQSVYKDSTDVKKLKQLAYASLMSGRLSEAEKHYLNLYKQLPEDAGVLLALGTISANYGLNAKAKAYFLAVLNTDSTNFKAYKQLAKLENDLSSTEKMTYLLKANHLDTLDAEVCADLSMAYFRNNQFNKADEILKNALSADSANLLLLNAKMPISLTFKAYSEAIAIGKKILATQKVPSEQLLLQMAQSYRGLRDYKNAAVYLKQAIKEGISTKTASYYGLLGDTYENMNQNKEALEVYKRGLLFENNGSLYYNIALIYENKLNDKKNAISYYSQYLNSIKEPEKQKRHIAYIKNKIEELKR
ncbi:tetratricopeptide (TPR) repeat protein [Pedobacter sp. AK017]|uniref:tetratricopeptide repeat protein n=1 Tax=Pedobacter sp. AK017 TaxID=2723073 RepID=UPI0016227D3A|nr:tetratricopeptide repeat protein [Pedobacter sp. AK017]MBB5440556.1 tetratricopeptide (TPR) repeat protein [Pedobacter sp. AK017]